MKKAAIVLSEVIVGVLIGMGTLGCGPGIFLVLPFLFLWLAAFAVLHDSYQEHLRATLRFDATIPISITVAVAPVFFGMMVCAELG